MHCLWVTICSGSLVEGFHATNLDAKVYKFLLKCTISLIVHVIALRLNAKLDYPTSGVVFRQFNPFLTESPADARSHWLLYNVCMTQKVVALNKSHAVLFAPKNYIFSFGEILLLRPRLKTTAQPSCQKRYFRIVPTTPIPLYCTLGTIALTGNGTRASSCECSIGCIGHILKVVF